MRINKKKQIRAFVFQRRAARHAAALSGREVMCGGESIILLSIESSPRTVRVIGTLFTHAPATSRHADKRILGTPLKSFKLAEL